MKVPDALIRYVVTTLDGPLEPRAKSLATIDRPGRRVGLGAESVVDANRLSETHLQTYSPTYVAPSEPMA